jgi:hypothetical protein
MREAMRVAMSECPPSSKKLSWMPMRSTPRTWAQIPARVHGMLVYGPGQFFLRHQDSEKADDMVGTPGTPSRSRVSRQRDYAKSLTRRLEANAPASLPVACTTASGLCIFRSSTYPRPLQLNATSRLSPHSSHFSRAKPRHSCPQPR